MPNIKVKSEYINKLKELGVYDQWLENVKNQWDNPDRCGLNPESPWYAMYNSLCIDRFDWKCFIIYTIDKANSNEGRSFWDDIIDKVISEV